MAKLSFFIYALITIAIIVGGVQLVQIGFGNAYNDTVIDNQFTEQYNYIWSGYGTTASINSSLTEVGDYASKAGESESKWQVFSQIATFPIAIFKMVTLVFLSPVYLILMLTNINTDLLLLPPTYMALFGFFLTAGLIFAVVEWYKGYKT